MSHKVHPKSFRLREMSDWDSRWFSEKQTPRYLEEDFRIRDFLMKKFKDAGIEKIEIERSPNRINVIVNSSRPGLIIGRGGEQIEELKDWEDDKIKAELIKLSNLSGRKVSFLPEISFLSIIDSGNNDIMFSIVRDNAYNNISHLLSERTERLKNEDKLTVARGFIGSYPNVFLKVTISDLPAFVEAIKGFSSEEDYKSFLDKVLIRIYLIK